MGVYKRGNSTDLEGKFTQLKFRLRPKVFVLAKQSCPQAQGRPEK